MTVSIGKICMLSRDVILWSIFETGAPIMLMRRMQAGDTIMLLDTEQYGEGEFRYYHVMTSDGLVGHVRTSGLLLREE